MTINQTADILDLFDPSGVSTEMFNTAFAFSKKELQPVNRKMDMEGTFHAPLWKALGQQDMHGVAIDPAYGGVGASYMAHLSVIEAISYWNGGAGLSVIANGSLFGYQMQKHGTDEQKAEWLPPLCRGDIHGALAMSEPNAGSDVMAMNTSWQQADGGVILNGHKTWITNGGTADAVIVYAKAEDEHHPKDLTTFIVRKDTTGFTAGPKIDKMGVRGSETYPLYFDNCFIPEKDILKGYHQGLNVLKTGLVFERLSLAIAPIALAQRALDYTVNYLKTREQFGKPLFHQQALGHQLIKMQTQVNTARKAIYMTAAQEVTARGITAEDAAEAFYTGSDTGVHVTGECIVKCGGAGYTKELPLELLHRDAKLYQIGGGACDVQNEILYRAEMKKPPTAQLN